MSEHTKKKSFLGGAAILAGAAVIIKVMGAFFRIPLSNIIGSLGMSYYQTGYPLYNLFLTISTAGIPVAISRMVSERQAVGRYYEAHRVFRTALLLLLGIGAISASLLFFGAGAYAESAGIPEATMATRALAPALFFVSVMAAFRGYFQGNRNMKPTALSQLFEQFFRVGLGLTLAVVLTSKGLEYAAAGASFGAAAGGMAGLITMIIIYMLARESFQKKIRTGIQEPGAPTGKILVQILMIALPITIGSSIMPLLNMIDVQIVVNRLVATGYTPEAAKELFGELTGFAQPLINLPQVLIQAIAVSLVPTIAAAYKQKDHEDLSFNIQTGMRTAMIIAMPCAFGMMSLSEPIMLFLYPAEKASAISAAPLLFILAFGIIFLSGIQTLTAILQGIGKQNVPMINLMIGAVVKIFCTMTLTGIPEINVKGAAIGTVATYFVTFVLNMIAVYRYTGTRFPLVQIFFRPLVSVGCMSVGAIFGHRAVMALLGSNSVATLAGVAVGGCLYVVMIFVTKTITPEELTMLPKGDKLAKLFRKIKK
ncbi:MAG: polysaccharide biosynthesis protein [Firmicutes bacterium]|nr:polysaccharide biosynthesis protein [Bacillota bacterium]